MGLLDANYSAVNGKKPRNSGRLFAGEELNGRGLLDAATNIPVVGDALSGGMAIYDAAKGDYGSAAMNAAAMLPFLSAGMIKGGKVADALNSKHSALDAYISESPNQLTLSKVVVPKEMRNQGAGTSFMNDLVSEADKAGKTVALTPASDFGGSKARLQEFYKRFGFVPNKGKNADYEISEAMYRTPQTSAVNTRPLTEFEQRHLTAQKNAALPVEQGGLGLPVDNTAMDRAKGLGFDTENTLYHGTKSDVSEFIPSRGGEFGSGVYSSNDPNMANMFASFASGDSGENIIPLVSRANSPLVTSDRNIPRGLGTKGLTKKGFDSVEGIGATGQTQNVVLDPSMLRSRFAAFDPMRRHEADLLGYADPRLLGGIAGGGLLGLGGYSLMGDK